MHVKLKGMFVEITFFIVLLLHNPLAIDVPIETRVDRIVWYVGP